MKIEKGLDNAETEDQSMNIKTPTVHKPVNALPSQMYDGWGGWQLRSIMSESGAAEIVIPYTKIKGHKI